MMKNTNHFEVVEQKHLVHLNAERIALYNQCKIIEAYNEENESYYLFFYKNKFLTGKKTKSIAIHSTIAKAFKKGIVLQAPHPILNSYLSQQTPLKLCSFNELLRKLQKQQTPQEIALIFTFFDSFIKRSKIKKLIQANFYQHRRDGQMYKAYQILNIYNWFFPKSKWGADLAANLQYQKYAALYKEGLRALKDTDPLFAEIISFRHRYQPQSYKFLTKLFEQEGRINDLLALHIDKLLYSTSAESFHLLAELLEHHTSEAEQTQILHNLYQIEPSLPELQRSLFERFVAENQLEEAVQLLLASPIQLSNSQQNKIKNWIEHTDDTLPLIQSQESKHALIELFSEDKKLERIIQRYVEEMMNEHSIIEIKNWLAPFKNSGHGLLIDQKLEKMISIAEDPEQQSTLGQLYCEFLQYEKAIECYKWEMELKPADPTPVQSLSKLYETIGQSEESSTYQQILVAMSK